MQRKQASRRRFRALIIEDEWLIAYDIVHAFEKRHWDTVVVGTVGSALAALAEQDIDFATLDYQLVRRRTSEEVAAELARRGIMFVVITGMPQDFLPTEYRAAMRLTKPIDYRHLDRLIREFENIRRSP